MGDISQTARRSMGRERVAYGRVTVTKAERSTRAREQRNPSAREETATGR